MCRAGAAGCGQKSLFHHLLHPVLPGGFSALGTTVTIPPAPHGKAPVLFLGLHSVPLSWEPNGADQSPILGRVFPAGAPPGKHTPGDISGSAQESPAQHCGSALPAAIRVTWPPCQASLSSERGHQGDGVPPKPRVFPGACRLLVDLVMYSTVQSFIFP